MHEYFIIARDRVHETHQLMPRGGVDQLVDVSTTRKQRYSDGHSDGK